MLNFHLVLTLQVDHEVLRNYLEDLPVDYLQGLKYKDLKDSQFLLVE